MILLGYSFSAFFQAEHRRLLYQRDMKACRRSLYSPWPGMWRGSVKGQVKGWGAEAGHDVSSSGVLGRKSEWLAHWIIGMRRLPAYLPACFAWLLVCIPVCTSSISLFVCLCTCNSGCLVVFTPTCLLAYLPTYLLVWLPACLTLSSPIFSLSYQPIPVFPYLLDYLYVSMPAYLSLAVLPVHLSTGIYMYAGKETLIKKKKLKSWWIWRGSFEWHLDNVGLLLLGDEECVAFICFHVKCLCGFVCPKVWSHGLRREYGAWVIHSRLCVFVNLSHVLLYLFIGDVAVVPADVTVVCCCYWWLCCPCYW